MERLRQLLEESLAFLRALVWPAVSSVRGNIGLAGLSIVLAFALWIFVTDTESSTRTGVVPLDLEVKPVNVPNDVALAGNLGTVRVRVRAAEDVWDTLSAEDFEATVELDGVQAGSYELPVRVKALTGRGGLRITQVIPSTVGVDVEPLFSKSVPVTVELEGTPPVGFEARNPQSDESTVLVTGPQGRVSLVAQAVATLDLTGRTETIRQAVRLEPRDDRGFLVEGVSLEPSVTEVRGEIEQIQFSRAMVVSPTVVGTPAVGYNVAEVSVEPPTVTVFGTKEFVQGGASVRTRSVDVTGAKGDVVRSVSLDLPAGASVSGGTTVTVRVRILPAQGQRTLGVTVRAEGLGDDLQIVGALPSVQVTLLGELPALQSLGPNDIAAEVNLAGLGAGTHIVPVSVTDPGGLLVAAVSPDKVELVLEKR